MAHPNKCKALHVPFFFVRVPLLDYPKIDLNPEMVDVPQTKLETPGLESILGKSKSGTLQTLPRVFIATCPLPPTSPVPRSMSTEAISSCCSPRSTGAALALLGSTSSQPQRSTVQRETWALEGPRKKWWTPQKVVDPSESGAPRKKSKTLLVGPSRKIRQSVNQKVKGPSHKVSERHSQVLNLGGGVFIDRNQ